MNFVDYLRVVARRWKVVAVCLLLGIGAAILATALSPRTYQAKVQIFVSAQAAPSNDAGLYLNNVFAQNRIASYVQIVDAPDVINRVIADSRVDLTPSQLRSMIDASAQTGSAIIYLTVNDTSPSRAATIANSAGRAYIHYIEDRESPPGSTKSYVSLAVTQPAHVPTTPIAPKPLRNLLLGMLVGLFAGVTLALFRETADNTIRTSEALADVCGAPVLGVVVNDDDTKQHVIASQANMNSIRSENFRQLRTSLQFAGIDQSIRVIAVTSCVAAEGKTSTAINVAASLTEVGKRVVLVDADLRHPSVAAKLDLPGVGLTNVLIKQSTLETALQYAGDGLSVLAAGTSPPNPAELLGTPQMHDLIETLKEKFDHVIIDNAPLLPVTDGAQVAAIADGTLLVVRYGSTTDGQVSRAVATLRGVDAQLLGAVFNRVPPTGGAYGSSYYYYYNGEARSAGHRRGRRARAAQE
jgi:capsular exopolysaccharide synthesis family protein